VERDVYCYITTRPADTSVNMSVQVDNDVLVPVMIQICALLRDSDNNAWTSVWLNEQVVPYMYHDQQWVAYDNADSVTYKARTSTDYLSIILLDITKPSNMSLYRQATINPLKPTVAIWVQL